MSTITPLEGVDSSSRVLRTSIYLRTSLEKSDGKIQDLLDCVVPIVGDSLSQLPTGQIILNDLGQAIFERFSFKMPTFTIEHVLGRLAQIGKVTYDKDQKAYFKEGGGSISNGAEEATTIEKIRHLERSISEYAEETFNINEPPFFPNWSDVIVYFLHPDSISASKSIKKIKGTLISDFDDIIRKIVSNFILFCQSEEKQNTYEVLVEIYGGILLGDFLQNIQSTGNPESFRSLTVLYDTTVLLRLLGCSGPELWAATMEMHRDLQSLGCKTEYLSNNETELCNILDTIINRYDSHQLIFGETGEALSKGKEGVQIGVLRELNTGYPEALAALNIFSSKYSFQNTKTANYHQIDEVKFQDILAGDKDNYYGEQNRISDAQSLAVVMRLRQSSKSHDLGTSKYVFVTANAHLARSARFFVRNELGHTPQYVPPILTHSQMSTAAWISSETRLQDSAISRELLANCMSAQQVSKEWVDGFIEILKKAEIAEEDHTIIHAVRSIARDESLGNPTILRKLNPNEMLTRAKAAEEKRLADLAKQHKSELQRQAENSAKSAREDERRRIAKEIERHSERLANAVVRVLEIVLVIPFTIILILGLGNFDPISYKTWLQPFAFVVLTSVAVLDLFQFQPIRRLTNPLRRVLTRLIGRILSSE
ncbi:hypothetical protein GI582_18065 [Sulfitobacter sp. BDSS02]|nr:hypothetical protein [Sulfitobacter sp. BDSS02]MBR9852036.1 transposase [Paracoccaceae bacterium]